MRILYVIDSLAVGGAEVLLLAMATRYAGEGHRIRVAYFTHGLLVAELESVGIPTHRLSRHGWRDPLALPRLVRLIRAMRPDVVHTHLAKSDVVGQTGAVLSRVPVRVSTLHNVGPGRPSLAGTVHRASLSWCHRVIAVSAAVRDHALRWSRLPRGRFVVVDNGVDLDRFDPNRVGTIDWRVRWGLAAGAQAVGVVARLVPAKGHAVLLEAATRVVGAVPGTRFVVVGDGPLRQTLEARSASLGLDGQVVFAGATQDVPGVLAALDVVAFPSLWEGLPVALLEAMAMRRPVVASAVGGVPSVIADGENGWLVPPGDAGALAETLIRLLRDDPLRTRMGRNARETVRERFSEGRMHRMVMELYTSLLASGPDAGRPATSRQDDPFPCGS